MVGPTLGPTLGGWITDNYNWPWIFYINVPLGIIAAILTVTYIKDAIHQERADKIDYLGIILLTLCVGSLQWMLERGERSDWWESRFITMLAFTALLAGIALIWHELTTDEPIINFRILKSRQVTAGVSIGLLLGFALYGSVFILPVFLQQLLQMTAWQTGKIILPGAIASAVTMAGGRGVSLFPVDVEAVAPHVRERLGRSLLAADSSRHGTRTHLRSPDQRDDG
jgi:DHA2 family multidrug resistance protein